MPKFDLVACLTMIIVLMITAVESTGSTIATGEIVGKRIKASDIGNVLRADGLATAIGGVFNSFPYTAFSENVGLVRLTGVKSRWVVAAAGVIMIILGFLPKVAAIVSSIPNPVLGGAALTLFATVAVVGIQTLGKVDFTDHRNLIIVTTSIALALWVTSYPDVAKAMPTGHRSAVRQRHQHRRDHAPSCSTSCSSISVRAGRGWPAADRSPSTRSTR